MEQCGDHLLDFHLPLPTQDGSVLSFQFSSVALSNPMDCSKPGLPVLHHLLELAQTHWVGDAIQLSHPLSSLFPPAFNLSQHQGLFKWINSSHEVAKVLESASASVLPKNTQDWSPLGWTGWISSLSKGLTIHLWHPSTTIQKHQLFGDQLLYNPTLTSIYDYWNKHNFDYMDLCQQSDGSAF